MHVALTSCYRSHHQKVLNIVALGNVIHQSLYTALSVTEELKKVFYALENNVEALYDPLAILMSGCRTLLGHKFAHPPGTTKH